MGVAEKYLKDLDQIYTVKPKRWYEAHPYAFQFISREYGGGTNPFKNTKGRVTFNLPIAPRNLTVTTHFATNIITTLYGIVEEHSEVRYYDIVIAGTTGYAPEHYNPVNHKIPGKPKPSLQKGGAEYSTYRTNGRGSFDDGDSLLGGLGDVLDVIGLGASALGALGQIAEDVNNVISGGNKTSKTGIDLNKSGYQAFHNFYRFLLLYKKDAAGIRKGVGFKESKIHPLLFINYKDNVKYDCVPLNFNLVRDATDPMIYNYTLTLRAFNMRQTTGGISSAAFQANLLASVGLTPDTSTVDTFGDTMGAAIDLISDLASIF